MSQVSRIDKVANPGEIRCSRAFGCGGRRRTITVSYNEVLAASQCRGVLEDPRGQRI
jgi:hypothetical protein